MAGGERNRDDDQPCRPHEPLRNAPPAWAIRTVTADELRGALAKLFGDAVAAGRAAVVVRSGDLHRIVGGYPGSYHRMPVCCNVMYAEMVDGVDEILTAPPKGQGASLTIEFLLPRPGGG